MPCQLLNTFYGLMRLTLMLHGANLANAKWCKNNLKMIETLENWYSSESTPLDISIEYQHYRASEFLRPYPLDESRLSIERYANLDLRRNTLDLTRIPRSQKILKLCSMAFTLSTIRKWRMYSLKPNTHTSTFRDISLKTCSHPCN